jgi:AraC-like DNA-binding protein
MKSSLVSETSLAAVDESDRVDAWQEACREALLADRVWPVPHVDATFTGDVRHRWIDDLLFVEFESSGFGGCYGTNSLANDYLGFGVSADSYGERVTARDSQVHTVWGASYLWANAKIRDYELIGTGRSLILYLPRDAIRSTGGHLAEQVDLSPELRGPSARMLRVMLEALREEQDLIEPGEAMAIRNSLLELVARVFREDEPPSGAAVSRAMRRSVEAWIDRRLHLGVVSPVDAAAAHGISVRSLCRVFEGSGESFSSLVRSARVARARRDVIEGRDSCQTIAMRWGFADASHFTREFRRHFGTTPRGLRAEVEGLDQGQLCSPAMEDLGRAAAPGVSVA